MLAPLKAWRILVTLGIGCESLIIQEFGFRKSTHTLRLLSFLWTRTTKKAKKPVETLPAVLGVPAPGGVFVLFLGLLHVTRGVKSVNFFSDPKS